MTMTDTRTYPMKVVLVGSCGQVTIRKIKRGDSNELLRFFLRIPEEDRWYLRADVTSLWVISNWMHHDEPNDLFAVVGVVDGRIVAIGTVRSQESESGKYSGGMRVVVEPKCRNQGIGSIITQELIDLAYDNSLDRVIFELVEGKQDRAIRHVEGLGFIRVQTRSRYVQYLDTEPLKVVVMELPVAA